MQVEDEVQSVFVFPILKKASYNWDSLTNVIFTKCAYYMLMGARCSTIRVHYWDDQKFSLLAFWTRSI